MTSGQGRHAARNRRRTVEIILTIVGFVLAAIGIIQDVRTHQLALSLAVGLAIWTVVLAIVVVHHRLLAHDGYSGSVQDPGLEGFAIVLCWIPIGGAVFASYMAHRGVEGWLIILIALVGYAQWRERRAR